MIIVSFTIHACAFLDGCSSIYPGCPVGVITKDGMFQKTGVVKKVEKQGNKQGPCSYVEIRKGDAYYVPYGSKPTSPGVTVMDGETYDIVKVTVKVIGELPLRVSIFGQTFEVPT